MRRVRGRSRRGSQRRPEEQGAQQLRRRPEIEEDRHRGVLTAHADVLDILLTDSPAKLLAPLEIHLDLSTCLDQVLERRVGAVCQAELGLSRDVFGVRRIMGLQEFEVPEGNCVAVVRAELVDEQVPLGPLALHELVEPLEDRRLVLLVEVEPGDIGEEAVRGADLAADRIAALSLRLLVDLALVASLGAGTD
jgi:hypothetical protein